MRVQPKSLIPTLSGLAVGVGVLAAAGTSGAAASSAPWSPVVRPAMAAQVDVGKLAPLAAPTSYKYTLDVKATGTEAAYMREDYEEAG